MKRRRTSLNWLVAVSLVFSLTAGAFVKPAAAEGGKKVNTISEESGTVTPTPDVQTSGTPAAATQTPDVKTSATPAPDVQTSGTPASATQTPDAQASDTPAPGASETKAPASPDASAVRADISVSREEGVCTFDITGLKEGTKQTVTVEAADSATKEVKWQKDFETEEAALSVNVSLKDLEYAYGNYTVTVKVDGVTVGEPAACDFSIHLKKMDLSVLGEEYDTKRTFRLNSTEASGGVLVPGKGNQASIYVWQGKSDKNAEQIGKSQEIKGSGISWKDTDVSAVSVAGYGTWNAKVVLSNTDAEQDTNVTLTSAEYTVAPRVTSFVTKKTSSLEKAQKFRVRLKGLKNAFGVKKVVFQVYSSAGKKLATVNAKKSSSLYTADVKYEDVNYKLEKLSVRAVVYDKKGKNIVLSKTAEADLSVKSGTMKVKPNNDATCDLTLTGAYIPGNISKVKFVIYLKKGKKLVKQDSYIATSSAASKKFAQNIPLTKVGDYVVYTYAYTSWDKCIRLSTTDYEIVKKNLGKQGWVYEKVNGRKYKFYYVDNQKVTDLTNILKLTPNGSNKMYIEVNRAAAVVTFYAYDSETQKYDIPIKSATVSVGRDIRTVAGAGALNIYSSFTPIGTYSVCSNGAAVRYSLKPMHEPDGSTVYARWCTHIVGNVYFHAIAVGAQSHYALSATSYNKLGGPASAGCIRMTVADAKWLYTYAPTGTQVKIVAGSTSNPGPYGKPATIKISGVNYDPTDPEVPDARKKADYAAGRISGYMTKKGEKVGY